MTSQIRVVVIGGGYAGVLAANRLTARDDVRVILLNPRPTFVDRIRLHQLVAGTHDAVVELRTLLNPRVRLVVGTAERVDAADRLVHLAGGERLAYDRLVLAVGSGSAPSPVPGAAEHAIACATLEDARRLRAALARVPVDAPVVVVVGAGPTGIELAAELGEAGRPVALVCGPVLGPSLHPRTRTAVAATLARLGVDVLQGPRAVAVEAGVVRLDDGRVLPAAVVAWTAGFGVPDLARRSGLTVDAEGRVRTDETLTSVDDERIVAVGDAAAPSGVPYRMSCQSATQLGPQAAETVLSRIAGRVPAPVSAGFAGQCISLGRRAGVFQVAHRNDVVTPLRIGGRPGATLKEAVCRSVQWELRTEAAHPGRMRWWLGDRSRADRVAAAGPLLADRIVR